jgi:hypothetical protein
MPVFPKRRFQHGAAPAAVVGERLGESEGAYRARWLSQYA